VPQDGITCDYTGLYLARHNPFSSQLIYRSLLAVNNGITESLGQMTGSTCVPNCWACCATYIYPLMLTLKVFLSTQLNVPGSDPFVRILEVGD